MFKFKIKRSLLQLTLFIVFGMMFVFNSVFAADKTLMAGESLVLTGDVIWDNLYSTATDDNWAVVTGDYDIIVTGDVDIEFVSFQNTGTIAFKSDNDNTIDVDHCVFYGQSGIEFGSNTTSLSSTLNISNSDFRLTANGSMITISGASGDSTGIYRLFHNTFVLDGGFISIDNKDGIGIDNNIFYNAMLGDFQSLSGGWRVENNFFSSDSDYESATNFIRSRYDEKAITYNNNYIYADYPNPHISGMTGAGSNGETRVWSNNIFESTDQGANIIFIREQQPLLAENNIIVGTGALVSNVGGKSNTSAVIKNNTVYSTNSSTYGSLFLIEGGTCENCVVEIYNNVVDGNVQFGSMVENQLNDNQEITYAGHNNVRQSSPAYSNYLTFANKDDDTALNPQFNDPTRTLLSWSLHKGGAGVKSDVIDNLLKFNGYNSNTLKQEQIGSGYDPYDLIQWVRNGYTTGETSLQTLGRYNDQVGIGQTIPSNLVAWLDHSIKKYRQDGEDGTSGPNSLTVKMAKNEFESFQVFVYADGEDLSNVDVNVSNFTNGSDVIDDIYIYKEHYVNCSQKSREEFETGYYPDALLPKVDRFYNETRNTFPFDVSNGKIQGIWVDVGTDTATAPGTYTATVTISADGKPDIQLPVTLEVWNFALPSTSSFPANYVFRANAVSFGHGYERNHYVSPSLEIIDQYMKMFLYHRAVPVIRGDGRSMHYVWDNQTKKLTIDRYDPWESWLRPGMEGTAITSGPYAGAKFPVIHISNYDKTNNDVNILNTDKQNATRQYFQQQFDRCLSNGWDPIHTLYNTVIDEPQCNVDMLFRGQTMTMCEIAYSQASDSVAINTHGAGMFDNVYVHSVKTKPGIENFEDYGFYSPNIATLACPSWNRTCNGVAAPSGGSRDDYKDFPYWSYLGCSSNGCGSVCGEYCTGAIDSSVDAPAIYNRAASFYRYVTKATGSFFWGVLALNYSNDTYFNIWSDEFASNGDGHLLYAGITSKSGRTWNSFAADPQHIPELGGIHDIPIASIRWKYIRDQEEDLEYFKLAEDKTDRNTVLNHISPVFNGEVDPKFAYWNLNLNPAILLSAREDAANLITTNQIIRADVDQNSTINSTDAMLTLRNSLGLDMSQTNWFTSTTTGDVNCDGTTNSTDAMLILRHSLGLSMNGTGWCVE